MLNEKQHQLEIVDNLKPVADELGCTLAQLSLAWCLKNPHVSSVITGATKVEQVSCKPLSKPALGWLTDNSKPKAFDITSAIVQLVGFVHACFAYRHC